VHLNAAGSALDYPWKGKFDQDPNRPNLAVWHVASPEDAGEQNLDWYHCEIYNGEPPDWSNPGKPIAVTAPFQMPHTGHERVVTVELQAVSHPLDLARFKAQWDETGPAAIIEIRRPQMPGEHPLWYELELRYTRTNHTERIQCAFERDPREGDKEFTYWLLVDEQGVQ
jgi:hypothetical protein